jgi:hemolysin type calcium-binding protein
MYWQAIRLLTLFMLASSTLTISAQAAELPAPKPIPEPRCRYLETGPPGPRGNALLIDHSMHVFLLREGIDIEVLNRRDGEPVPIPCEGGAPTVRSVDRILYRPALGAHQLTIDESHGRLAPGATAEAGADEIEIAVRFPPTKPQRRSSLRIFGAPGSDAIRIGSLAGTRTGIDLDAGGRARLDADVIVSAASSIQFQIAGEGGDDRLSAAGVAKPFTGPLLRSVALRGGEGSDLLVGGSRRDRLDGWGGDDLLYGRGGDDFLAGGDGEDRVFGGGGGDALADGGEGSFDYLAGGPGNDAIGALDGDRDRIECGAGIDNAWLDAVDLWRGGRCDKRHGPSFPR